MAYAEKTRELLEKLRAGWKRSTGGEPDFAEIPGRCVPGRNFTDYLIRIAKAPKKYTLTDTLLETLSIIAYKQPVTRLDVEKIRGVNCDHAINRSVEYNLVEELYGWMRQDARFYSAQQNSFCGSVGVGSLEELPERPPYRLKNSKSRQSRRRCRQ